MSDIRDDTVDDLESQLTRALRREADAHDPAIPASATIRGAAHRRERRRQLEIGSAVLVAAALLVVLIVGPWRGNEDAFVDSGPIKPRPALHLELDPAAGYVLTHAADSNLDTDGRPPGTVPGPEGRSSSETILLGGSDPLAPPWLFATVRTTENPIRPWGDPASNERPITIAGRPGVLRSFVASPDPASDADWSWIDVRWDDRHQVSARFWGLELDAAIAALASLHQNDDGAWTMGEPPAGMHLLAREVDQSGADWYQDSTIYQDSATGSMPMSPTLTLTRVEDRSETDLIARALGSSWEKTTTLERTTVRGQPAILVAPSTSSDVRVGPVPRYRVIWFEPDHDVVVDLVLYDADRAQVDRAVAAIRERTDAEWRTTLATCTDVEYGGTVASVPRWASGGPCPGFEMVGG